MRYDQPDKTPNPDDQPNRAEKLEQLALDRAFHATYKMLDTIARQYGSPQYDAETPSHMLWESKHQQFGRPDYIVTSYNYCAPNDNTIAEVALLTKMDVNGAPIQVTCFLQREGEGTGKMEWFLESARYTEENGKKVWCGGNELAHQDDLDLAGRQAILFSVRELYDRIVKGSEESAQ